jgi:glycosyltransferase involved in cell wall biosynthesis
MPARVLFINDTARNGGPGRSLLSILKFLDPAVVHRAVVLPREGVVSELLRDARAADELCFEPNLVENVVAPLGRAMRRDDFEAPLPLRAARFAGNVARAGVGLARLAQRARGYDLVYCNGTTADFAGGAIAALTGVAALWHVRYTSVPRIAAPLHRRLSGAPAVRRIVCVSRAAAGLFPHCSNKVRVIHNALDLDEFSVENVQPLLRSELQLPHDAVIFGSHGRVLRRKGYVEMIQAARLAIDRMDARAQFVVVGDTPEDFQPDHVAECRALVDKLGLAGRFHFVGFKRDVRPWVADFDVAVVPSVYPDPLPRAVIESMALGRPVIAFGVGGVAEMIEPDVTGTVVAPGDVEALACQIVRYAGDAGLRARHGRAARLRVERDFDARAHARAIQDQIVEVVHMAHHYRVDAWQEHDLPLVVE